MISHNFREQSLCQDVTGPFRLVLKSPFISAWRERGVSVYFKHWSTLLPRRKKLFPKDPSGKIYTVWCWETVDLSFFPRVTHQSVLEARSRKRFWYLWQVFFAGAHKGGLEKPEECFCVHSSSAVPCQCLLMVVVIIINRAGTKGLMDLCMALCVWTWAETVKSWEQADLFIKCVRM